MRCVASQLQMTRANNREKKHNCKKTRKYKPTKEIGGEEARGEKEMKTERQTRARVVEAGAASSDPP